MSLKRVTVLVGLLLIIGAVGVWAQADEVATDNRVLGIEAGFIAGYRLADSELVVGQSFALNLTVANNVQVGFNSAQLQGAAVLDTYGLLKIAYFVSPQLGFNIAVGTATVTAAATTTPAVGAGVFFNAFENKAEDAFSTALKFKLDYLADMSQGIDQGTIAFGLSGVFGL
jgi:hypothetical protein